MSIFAGQKIPEVEKLYKEFSRSLRIGFFSEKEKKIRSLLKEKPIQENLQKRVFNWYSSLSLRIETENPWKQKREALEKFQKSHEPQKEHTIEQLEKGLNFYTSLFKNPQRLDLRYWETNLKKLRKTKDLTAPKAQESIRTLKNLLVEKWQETIDEAESIWKKEKPNELKKIFFKELKEWLELVDRTRKKLEQAANGIKEQLSGYASLKDLEIKRQLNEKIFDWKNSLKFQLLQNNPYEVYENLLHIAEQKESINMNDLETYVKQAKELAQKSGIEFSSKYWEDELKKIKNTNGKLTTKETEEKLKLLQKLLFAKWKEMLDKAISQWQLQKIDELRRKFLAELKEWLGLLSGLKETLDDLSMDSGFLWDMSKGEIHSSNIDTLRKWMGYIKNNASVKQLCNLMGRIERAETTLRKEVIESTTTFQYTIPDINSREEIIGVKLSNDLETVLPQELALLADDETSILFDMKLLENRLMCFDMQGWCSYTEHTSTTTTIEVEEEKPGGPIIVCVDTSGSMSGPPEEIAKALTLVLTMQANSQKRDCLLINFSTSIETLELGGTMGIQKLFSFLQRSFHGGTDVAPAFRYALEQMKQEKFERSDMLVISDFAMPPLDNVLTQQVQKMKENQNRFFSLTIGNFSLNQNLDKTFDGQWIYNPTTMGVDKIKEVYDTIKQRH